MCVAGEAGEAGVCVCVCRAGEAGEVSGGRLLLQVRTDQLICNDMRVSGRQRNTELSFIFTEEPVKQPCYCQLCSIKMYLVCLLYFVLGCFI